MPSPKLSALTRTARTTPQHSLAGYRSLLHGRRPLVRGYATRQDETEALVKRIRALLDEGLAPHEIGVCTRFNLSLDGAEEKLRTAGIPTLRVEGPGRAGSRRGAAGGWSSGRCPFSA